MVKLLAILLLIFYSQTSFAQKEDYKWYFGMTAGLDFSSGSPLPINTSDMTTVEGCASIADSTGELLFYTDGKAVYNKNNKVMPNGSGLKANSSTTQAATIIEDLANEHLYYIFTLGAVRSPDGLQYSIVDMSRQSGLGDVIVKNIFVRNDLAEKLCAVRSCDNKSYWIIVHESNSDRFISYSLGLNGFVSTSPVISATGVNYAAKSEDYAGYMKLSPDSSKIASVVSIEAGTADILSIDNKTGRLLNLLTINKLAFPYGVEFSPSGQFLYVSERYTADVYQYNLSALNAAAVNTSKYLAGGFSNGSGGALQRGPDGKIYYSFLQLTYKDRLSVIQNPDIAGKGCSFVSEGVYVGKGKVQMGLPNIVLPGPPLITTFMVTQGCKGKSSVFSFNKRSIVYNLEWLFGDKNQSRSNERTPSFVYSDTGTYRIVLRFRYGDCGMDSVVRNIRILDVPEVDLGDEEIEVCSRFSLTLRAKGVNAKKYLWNNNPADTFSFFAISKPGLYKVTVKNQCGQAADSVLVKVLGATPLNLGNDTDFCARPISLLLHAGPKAKKVTWSTGDTLSPAISVNDTGTYWLRLFNGCEWSSDTIRVTKHPAVKPFIGNDTVVCFIGGVSLSAPAGYKTYFWNTGDTSASVRIKQPGLQWVQVTNNEGCKSGDSIMLRVPASDQQLFVPNAFSPNNDRINDLFPADETVPGMIINIYDRWGEHLYSTSDGRPWDGIYVNKPVQEGVYYYEVIYMSCRNNIVKERGLLTLIY